MHGSAPASACSIILPPHYSNADAWADAKARIRNAVLIVDGEVIRPIGRESDTARVRVVRVLKGPAVDEIEIGVRGECDMQFVNTGERMRMVLEGGPDVYFMRGFQGRTEFVDRLLGSNREKDWPYKAGTSAPVDDHRYWP